MRRLEREDGAVSVIAAIMLIVLMGMAALAVDVGNLYWERRQLQNAADAAALAAAQDIVDGRTQAVALTTARTYADANNARGAFVRPSEFVVDDTGVTVTARTGSLAEEGTLTSILAGVLGVDTYATQASATASLGLMGSGTSIPLTFSICEWRKIAGDPPDASKLPPTEITMYLHSTQTARSSDCAGPANQVHPGGFGWLTPTSGACEATVVNGEVQTDTGTNVPRTCSQADLKALIGGAEILVPIFDAVRSPGSNAVFTIVGFAAMEVTGYRLSGNQYNEPVGRVPCSGNDRCIRGRFVNYYKLGTEPVTGGGQDLGAYLIGLSR